MRTGLERHLDRYRGTGAVRRPIAPFAATALFVAAALSCLIGIGPTSRADAQFACNGPGPGRRMVGMAPGGPGVAPTPLCQNDAAPAAGGAAEKPFDPAGNMVAAVTGMAQILLHDTARMASDPLYQRLRDGYWQYFKSSPDVRRGDYCMAAYATLDGIITLAGPGGDYRGAMLSFTGAALPRPGKQGLILVTLDDGDGKPATVRAISYADAGTKLGTIAFAVPGADAMLAGMTDVTHYRLTFGGKTFEIGWKNGDEARRKLKQCIATGA